MPELQTTGPADFIPPSFFDIRAEDVVALESDEDDVALEDQYHYEEYDPFDVSPAPPIRRHLSASRISETVSLISNKLFAGGLYEIVENEKVITVRLFDQSNCWYINREKRIVCFAPVDNNRHISDWRFSFPSVFVNSRTKNSYPQTPQSDLDDLVSEASEKLVAELLKSKTLESKDKAKFYSKLRAHLAFKSSVLLRGDGEALKWHLARKFHTFIPGEVLKFAFLMSWTTASALDVTVIWQNLEEVLAVYQTAPALLPVWLAAIKSEITRKNNDLARKRASTWKRIDSKSLMKGKGILEFTKRLLETGRKVRITPRAWRFLCKRSYLWSRMLVSQTHPPDLDSIARWFNFISFLNAEPKFSVYKFIYKLLFQYGYSGNLFFREIADGNKQSQLDMAAFLSAYIKAGNLATSQEINTDQLQLLKFLDYWRNVRPKLDANQRRAKWQWFTAAQNLWHEEREISSLANLPHHIWKSKLDFHRDGTWVAVSLNNTPALYYEAKLMNHCADDYVEQCRQGSSRIFHLARLRRKHTEFEVPAKTEKLPAFFKQDIFDEHATVEIVAPADSGDQWVLRQIESFSGSTVSARARKFGEKVAIEYSKRSRLRS